MSNKINSLTIALKNDITEEQADKIAAAMSLFDGVIGVQSNITDHTTFMIESRIKMDVAKNLMETLFPGNKK